MDDYFKIEQGDGRTKKSGGKFTIWLTNNIIGISSILLLIIVIYLLFVASFDLDISTAIQETVSAFGIVTAAATLILYGNGYSVGDTFAKNSQSLVNIVQRYAENVKNIIIGGLTVELDRFCEEYKKRELEEYRKGILANANISYVEYLDYIAGTTNVSYSPKQLKIIKKAINAKSITLSRLMLLSANGQGGRRNPITPMWTIQLYKYAKIGAKVLTLILCSSFVVSVGIHIYYNLSAETVISAIMQTTVLVGSFVSGFVTGRTVRTKYSQRQDEINSLFDEFFVFVKK